MYILSTVATDAIVLKLQATSIHSIDQISIALDQFQTKVWELHWTAIENKIKFGEENIQ